MCMGLLERKGPLDISRHIDQRWKQILGSLESIQKPVEAAIRHCRAHQGDKTKLELGKHVANEAAGKDMLENKVSPLIPLPEIPLPVEKPGYTAGDCQIIETVEARFDPQGWAVIPTGQKAESLLCEIVDCKHKAIHWSTKNY